ncbi:IS66 family insertion sequence element accessory protein TnpB [Photobacterium gaetbulicola]|uniref:IS66 family insertion sequence element accessory protein TnpB n=1 Tax=Photobacterium gaetbulicola TaxID=1295392 RepID=UPI0009E07F18|nr:IS66 family insertion sequence element accessory protein TnpB [Photobacterium gaetbulicola]
MITAPAGNVYLATGITDMRKSINTLGLLVEDMLELNPVGPHWFVFCNRRRDKLKILPWDTNDFGSITVGWKTVSSSGRCIRKIRWRWKSRPGNSADYLMASTGKMPLRTSP